MRGLVVTVSESCWRSRHNCARGSASVAPSVGDLVQMQECRGACEEVDPTGEVGAALQLRAEDAGRDLDLEIGGDLGRCQRSVQGEQQSVKVDARIATLQHAQEAVARDFDASEFADETIIVEAEPIEGDAILLLGWRIGCQIEARSWSEEAPRRHTIHGSQPSAIRIKRGT
jgi:hypothetical protein